MNSEIEKGRHSHPDIPSVAAASWEELAVLTDAEMWTQLGVKAVLGSSSRTLARSFAAGEISSATTDSASDRQAGRPGKREQHEIRIGLGQAGRGHAYAGTLRRPVGDLVGNRKVHQDEDRFHRMEFCHESVIGK